MFIGVIHDISEQKEYERQLTNSLREKETLLKEIHHRVKNNLLVVTSILEMQEDYVKDTNLVNILKESQNRIQSMALIHEKLYLSDTLADVDFTSYLDDLIDRLLVSYQVEPGKVQVVEDEMLVAHQLKKNYRSSDTM